MQIPSSEIQLLKVSKTGIPGRERSTYSSVRSILGSISPLSLADWTKRYANAAYIDEGAYSLATEDTLKVGDVLLYQGRHFKVFGFREGRFRNLAHLMVTDA